MPWALHWRAAAVNSQMALGTIPRVPSVLGVAVLSRTTMHA